ncbi:hypothetical protein RIF29_38050 [Crotalaria pallida]|uniref:Uncharacterized protein n=1 Tax=Crotalaria pallida TaxID=3830 RepID=A0AAN9HRZ3_CROPI
MFLRWMNVHAVFDDSIRYVIVKFSLISQPSFDRIANLSNRVCGTIEATKFMSVLWLTTTWSLWQMAMPKCIDV